MKKQKKREAHRSEPAFLSLQIKSGSVHSSHGQLEVEISSGLRLCFQQVPQARWLGKLLSSLTIKTRG